MSNSATASLSTATCVQLCDIWVHSRLFLGINLDGAPEGGKVGSFFCECCSCRAHQPNPAVTRTQALSLACPSIPLTPCSWLLGIVSQHPPPHPSSLNMRALLVRCPKLPPVHLRRPEPWARPSWMDAGTCRVKASVSGPAAVWLSPWAIRAGAGRCVKSSEQARF